MCLLEPCIDRLLPAVVNYRNVEEKIKVINEHGGTCVFIIITIIIICCLLSLLLAIGWCCADLRDCIFFFFFLVSFFFHDRLSSYHIHVAPCVFGLDALLAVTEDVVFCFCAHNFLASLLLFFFFLPSHFYREDPNKAPSLLHCLTS